MGSRVPGRAAKTATVTREDRTMNLREGSGRPTSRAPGICRTGIGSWDGIYLKEWAGEIRGSWEQLVGSIHREK